MSFENQQPCNYSAKAAADLSANQYFCVEASGDMEVNIVQADLDVCVGVLQDKPKSGYHGRVCPIGITKVVVGVACSYGNKLYAADSGYALPITTVGSGKRAIGHVLKGANSGGIAVAFITCANAVTAVTSVP